MGTAIDKLNYMSTTKAKIKDAINLTNVNITNDTFRSYETKFKQGIINTLNNPDAVWSNFTKVTGTGESLTLTPTEHAPMIVTLKGQTTQASTPTPSTPQPINVVSGDNTIEICGKNLLAITPPTASDQKKGITTTYDSTTGKISFSGTTTSSYPWLSNANIGIIPSGTQLVFSINTIKTYKVYARLYSSDNTYTTLTLNNATSVTGTTSKDVNRIVIMTDSASGVTLNDEIYLQIEKGSSVTEYEAYTGNSQLISLGVENLFDISTSQSYKWLTYQGVIQDSSDPNIVSAFIKVENGKQYIFSGIPTGTYTIRVCSYTGTTTNTFKTLLINNNSSIRTFTADADYIVFAIGQADATTLTSIQLTKGSTPQRVSDNPIELCKIGTYQDKIYKDNGIWYLHKEIGKKIITGTDSTLSRGGTNSQGYRWRVTLENPLPATSTSTTTPLFCNRLTAVTPGNTYNGIQGITIDTANDYCFFYITDIKNNSLDNTKTWLNTNNITLYYILNEATNTPIEDSELLEQLNSIKSCDGVTNISQSSSYEVSILDAIAIKQIGVN